MANRVSLALVLEEVVRARAKESQIRKPESVLLPVGKQKIHTDEELAKIAGVSRDTIRIPQIRNTLAISCEKRMSA